MKYEDVACASQVSNRNDLFVQANNVGLELEVAGHADSITGAHEDLCTARRGDSLTGG